MNAAEYTSKSGMGYKQQQTPRSAPIICNLLEISKSQTTRAAAFRQKNFNKRAGLSSKHTVQIHFYA